MKNAALIKRIVTGLTAALTLSACQTVAMPKLDFIKTPEFSEDAANINQSFPNVEDAPDAPTDVRSDKQWDKDARDLQALRNDRRPVISDEGVTEADDRARFEKLKAKAQAYKRGDPASGPVQGFPPYKPRR